jgi:hypothetical protein
MFFGSSILSDDSSGNDYDYDDDDNNNNNKTCRHYLLSTWLAR